MVAWGNAMPNAGEAAGVGKLGVWGPFSLQKSISLEGCTMRME